MRIKTWAITSTMIAAAGNAALAGDEPARIITATTPAGQPAAVRVVSPGPRYEVTLHSVVAPAATVNRGLADQPVHPYLVTVRIGSALFLVDPLDEHRHGDCSRGMDENHSLRKIKRAVRSAGSPDAVRIILGSPDAAAPLVEAPEPDPAIVKAAEPPATARAAQGRAEPATPTAPMQVQPTAAPAPVQAQPDPGPAAPQPMPAVPAAPRPEGLLAQAAK